MTDSAIESSSETSSPATRAAAWSPTRRVMLRFVWAYMLLYFYPENLDHFIPFVVTPFGKWHVAIWEPIVRVVGRGIGIDRAIVHTVTGSGDKTYDYVSLLCTFSAAVMVTVVWSVVDRRRKEYENAEAVLKVVIRYTLALIMLSYGMAKVLKSQFPFPSPSRLLEPYGESSPMGLLWTFMGYSTVYTIFAGCLEVLSALLLFFRRTTTLGALVAAGVMTNVVLLNFCYDVPVKLLSSHLLICALLLLSTDAHRLVAVFFLNRTAEAAAPRKPFPKRWMERTRIGLKASLIGGVLVSRVIGTIEGAKMYGILAEVPLFFGAYDVVAHVRDGKDLPPLLTDSMRLRHVAVSQYGSVIFMSMTGEKKRYRLSVDRDAKKWSLTPIGAGDAKPTTLHFETPDAEHVLLEGSLEGVATRIELRKIDVAKMLLVSRGFHWINEVPFNR